jgi:hypothetical protein
MLAAAAAGAREALEGGPRRSVYLFEKKGGDVVELFLSFSFSIRLFRSRSLSLSFAFFHALANAPERPS